MKSVIITTILILFVGFNIHAQTKPKLIEYWPNKNKKSMGLTVDSAMIGVWELWNENGTKGDSGAYIRLKESNIRIYMNLEDWGNTKMDTLKIKKLDVSKRKSTQTGYWVYRDSDGEVVEKGSFAPIAFIDLQPILDTEGNLLVSYSQSEGVKIGKWYYYDGGVLLAEQEHVIGIQYGYGYRIEYDNNGQKKQEGIYHENHMHWSGPVKVYNENGKLTKLITYGEHGELLKEENY